MSCYQVIINQSSRHFIPGCNLRHIKVGIRLVECLAKSSIFLRWLIEVKHYTLFQQLIELLGLPLIPMPIKILVSKLVYNLLDTTEGITQLNRFSGYKKIVDMLDSIIDIRLMYTLKAVIKKLHANENLENIKNLTTVLYKKVKDNCEFNYDDIRNLENLFIALKTSRKLDKIYSKKFLPIKTQFEIDPVGEILNLVSSYKANNFLETMMLLWDIKHTLSAKLISLLAEYLCLMTKDGNEMTFITNDIQLINNFVKMLNEEIVYGNDGSSKSFLNEIGIEIAYKIETKYHLDWILQPQCNTQLSECLSSLYGLCIGPGKKYALEFIAMDENLSVFLNLIDKEKSENQESHNIKQKSPVLNFSIDIIDLVVRHCEKLEYLRRYGSALLTLVKHHDIFEPAIAAILQEVAVFLKPLELKKVFTHDDIIPLIETVRRSKEYLTTFPGDLIMRLRILRYLIINLTEEEYKELKHDYFAVQFYHADGAANLVSILEKLTSYYDQPAVHSYLLGANQGILLTQIVRPTIQILRKIQVEVITSRNISFRDVTAIETLMKTYTLMQGVHSRSPSFNEAKTVQKEILKILLAYTQSLTPDGMTTTNIHKSLWTQMIGEVIKYMLNGPYRFVPGLLVMSELLPLPLPAPVESNKLSDYEMQRMVTERQLWSAHLHPQSHLITDMIQTFCTTSSQDLFQMTYRVCIQLSDLAPNMTLLVAKAVVDMVVAEPMDRNNEGTVQLARLLKFLAHLVRHPSVKVSVLSILSGRLADTMSLILTNINDEDSNHVATQIQVFMILHSLFDSEISLLFNSTHTADLVLSSGLPTKELIVQFAPDIVEVFCKTSVESLTFASIRSMTLLTSNDVTFNILKNAIKQRREKFAERMHSIADTCNLDRKHLSIVPDVLELLKAFIYVETVEPFTVSTRTAMLSIPELASLINWNLEENDKTHFLDTFFNLLKESESVTKDDMADVQNMNSMIKPILELLRDKSQYNEVSQTKDVDTVSSQLTLRQAEGIVTQFSSRMIFCVTELEELNLDYWFHNVNEDEEVLPGDLAQLDIDAIVQQCLPSETDVGSDCKRLLTLSSSPQSNRERNLSATCFRTRRVEVVDSTPGRMDKKIFNKCKQFFECSLKILQ
jgi:protein virilizer